MKITSVIENHAKMQNLLALHGQSFLIEYAGKRILFDLGRIYEGLQYNLSQLGFPLSDIDMIVISHRHKDHCLPLKSIISKGEFIGKNIYLPKSFGEEDIKNFAPRYTYTEVLENEQVNASFPKNIANKILNLDNTLLVDKGFPIYKNLWTTGALEAPNSMYEQALIYDQKELGLTLLLGCTHPGLLNVIKKSKLLTGNNKIRGIIGGLHLLKDSIDSVKSLGNELKKENLEFLIANHCTGIDQTIALKEVLGDIVLLSSTCSFGVGNYIEIKEDLNFQLI